MSSYPVDLGKKVESLERSIGGEPTQVWRGLTVPPADHQVGIGRLDDRVVDAYAGVFRVA